MYWNCTMIIVLITSYIDMIIWYILFVYFEGESFDWRMATLTKRPANLPDKTYGAPVGYAYFDIFNTGSRCAINLKWSPCFVDFWTKIWRFALFKNSLFSSQGLRLSEVDFNDQKRELKINVMVLKKLGDHFKLFIIEPISCFPAVILYTE